MLHSDTKHIFTKHSFLIITSLCLLCFSGCHNNSISYNDSRKTNFLAINNNINTTNKEVINSFVNDELLKNINIKQMYPPESVIKELGEIKSETIENAKIDYEGMIGNTLRKIEFNQFFAIIYQFDDGSEIFGHLSLKKDIKYSKFSIGSDIRNYINIEGDSINKWNNNSVTIYGSYHDDWEMEISVRYDDLYIIQEVDVDIGSI